MELGWLGHWLERGRLRPGLCNRPELGPGKQLLVSCVLLPRVLLPRALLSGLLSCIALLFAGRSLCLWLLQPYYPDSLSCDPFGSYLYQPFGNTYPDGGYWVPPAGIAAYPYAGYAVPLW